MIPKLHIDMFSCEEEGIVQYVPYVITERTLRIVLEERVFYLNYTNPFFSTYWKNELDGETDLAESFSDYCSQNDVVFYFDTGHEGGMEFETYYDLLQKCYNDFLKELGLIS